MAEPKLPPADPATNGALPQRLQQLMRTRLNIEVDDTRTDLIESGFLDSLIFVDLLVLLESECNLQITIEELEIDHFRTIESIADFVAQRYA